MPWRYLAVLIVANLALLLPNASPGRVTGALLLIGLLPGLSWARRLLADSGRLRKVTCEAGQALAPRLDPGALLERILDWALR